MCSIIGAEDFDIPQAEFVEGFFRTKTRGPDMTRLHDTPAGRLGFHRLAIMDVNETGMQPFALNGNYVVCNGELYGFRNLKNTLSSNYTFESNSDCEIILPLYEQYGLEMFKMLDAEFAMILYDGKRNALIAARDPIGIRPLYYGKSKSGGMVVCPRCGQPTRVGHKVREDGSKARACKKCGEPL